MQRSQVFSLDDYSTAIEVESSAVHPHEREASPSLAISTYRRSRLGI